MLEKYASADLSRMFNLYNNVPDSLKPIAQTVKDHISEVGNAIIDTMNEQKSTTKSDASRKFSLVQRPRPPLSWFG